MAETSLVTVLLPAYNAGDLLRPAVMSILAQTYANLEVLVLDDGSTDSSTKSIESEFADERLKVVHKSNTGLADTLNVGIELARGEYLARMDADDESWPNRIERQMSALAGDLETVLLGTQIRRTVNGEATSESGFPQQHDEIVRGLTRGEHVICHPSVVLRKEAVTAVGGYWSYGVAEDWDLYLRLAEIGSVRNLPDTLLDYRFHSGGINATSMRTVRSRVHLAIENHKRREAGQVELDPIQFEREMSRWFKCTVARESAALTRYRRSLAAEDWRAIWHLAWAGVVWPEQGARRVASRLRQRASA